MEKSKRLEVGKITSPHGLRGEVKLVPWGNDISIFETIDKLYDENGIEFRVISARYQKNNVLLIFEGINNIDQVEKLRNKVLLADRADLPPLAEGEHYIVDVLGMTVVSEDGSELGILRDWLDNGAYTVYIIKREGKKDVLIPAIPQFIKSVDYDGNIMMIKLIEGLVDDED